MLRFISAAALFFALSLTAKAQDIHGYTAAAITSKPVSAGQSAGLRHSDRRAHHRRVRQVLGDPRPTRWCGWQMRQWFGVADRSYNLARKWAGIGTPARGPAVGVIAVWPHHVGIVTAVPGHGRIVLKSGNDSGAVRERERSTRGIIAYRWPPGARLAMQ